MSRYVCDFESLRTIATNLKKHVSDMNTAVAAYETNMQSDLSGWTGMASREFLGQSSKQIENARKYITSIDELANYINDAVTKIENAENEISSITI